MRSVAFGSVEIVIQNSRIVQIVASGSEVHRGCTTAAVRYAQRQNSCGYLWELLRVAIACGRIKRVGRHCSKFLGNPGGEAC
ncbi:MAG: DUF2292 domain-containing protein [Deltaproteobacteria bacterium]|nr:DUF2292 domain-containing protein [Deltaproteobacteria bacterium]MBV8451507.1 DUF2292 domain-containing protein [Deltaproteobacteria bacterium]